VRVGYFEGDGFRIPPSPPVVAAKTSINGDHAMPTAAPIEKYRNCASAKFQYVKDYMGKFRNWHMSWKVGNALDTMIDYLMLEPNDAGNFGEEASALCNDFLGRAREWTWFDDYGWFVISTDRASQFFSGKVSKEFAGTRDTCWGRFQDAVHTWDWCTDCLKDYQPEVGGGVWNTYWICTPEEYEGDREGLPMVGALAGIQNTVTNALYLICAQRRGDAKAADDEYKFLDAWFSSRQPNLWWPQNNGGALVRERVSRFANGDTAPGFQEDWAWTGDQGLILGGLVGRIAKGQDAAKALTYAEALLTGVRLSLVDAHGLLRSFTATGIPPHLLNQPPDVADYATGPGVFWRYLLQAWNLNNADLRRVIGSEDYKTFVRENADAAANPYIDDPDLVINEIAALLAGIAILGQQ
jgi:hypothetical protein